MIKYGIFIQGGESMKKVISLALATLLCAAVFVGCGSGENTAKSSSKSTSSSSSSRSTSSTEPSTSTNEVTSTVALPTFNVDWDTCIAHTKEYSLMVPENYPYVKDVHIEVNDDKKEIIFMAILSDSTDPEDALDYADLMIRQLNMWARMQDESIASSTKDSYGGLYDVYSIRIGIAPLSQSQNQSKWFVSDYINKGLHTKHTIKLEKAYR